MRHDLLSLAAPLLAASEYSALDKEIGHGRQSKTFVPLSCGFGTALAQSVAIRVACCADVRCPAAAPAALTMLLSVLFAQRCDSFGRRRKFDTNEGSTVKILV
jgi:hypothetical protein